MLMPFGRNEVEMTLILLVTSRTDVFGAGRTAGSLYKRSYPLPLP